MGAGVAVAALELRNWLSLFSGFNAGEIQLIAVALGVFGATMVGLGYMLVLAAPALAGAVSSIGIRRSNVDDGRGRSSSDWLSRWQRRT